jgi:hypothetical protein
MSYLFGDELGYLRGTLRFDIDMVIDADPEYVAQAIEKGYNGLLFVHSEYAHPEWRPDREGKVMPWTTLVNRIELDKITKANDARLKEEDDGE